MFDLSIKIFDLSKVFDLPDTFLKSKNYCATFFIDWKPESKLLLPNVIFFACLEAFINWKVEGEIPCWAGGDWDFRAVMGAQVSCDVSTFRLLEIKENNKMQTHVSADLAAYLGFPMHAPELLTPCLFCINRSKSQLLMIGTRPNWYL